MKKLILLALGILSIFLVACSSPQTLYMCSDGLPGGGVIPEVNKDVVYVCPDGKETENLADCTFTGVITISQKDAETKSINFVNGYVRSTGATATLINVYPEKGNFYGQVVISKTGEQSYETTVEVDGDRGTVSCVSNCLYTTQII